MKRKISSILATASTLFTMTVAATAATFVYDIGTEVGATSTLLSTDGWTGTDLDNWVVGSGGDEIYARNQNDGDNTITRQNDVDFGYTIPTGTTSLTIEMTGRFGAGFWQAGIADISGNLLLGIGGDFNANNKYFIFEGSRFNESGTSATGDGSHTLRMEVNLLAGAGNGSASLFYDDTLILENQALTLPDLSTASGLYIRSSSRFVGPAQFTITAIPEPSSTALLGIAGLALILRRRK